MTITAHSGALGTFPSGVNSGEPSGQNPEPGPVFGHHGLALLDIRAPFTYQPGQDFGKKTYMWSATTVPVVDQVPSTIATNNIAASQAPVSGTALTLVSSSAAGITVSTSITSATTGKTVTGLLAIDTAMGSVGYGSAATVQCWDPTKAISRNIRITTNGDDTAGTYKVVGYDIYGYPMSETITGVNNAVASGKKAFKYITSVTPGGTIASTAVLVGTGDVYGFPLRADRLPYTQVWWNNSDLTGNLPITNAARQTFIIPVQLSDFVNSATWKVAVPYAGTVVSALFRTGKPASTAAKAATLTVTTNGGTAVTGGVMALTSANQNTTGGTVAATAISGAGASFTAGQTIEVAVSSVTAFVEGDGYVEFTVSNTDALSNGSGTFVAADATSPATVTTGDVRGTFAVPSASDNSKRLMMFVTLNATNAKDSAGMYGVTQV